MSWLREHRVALAGLTLFTLLAGDAWRYSLSWYGWGALTAVLGIAWVLVAVQERVDMRRVPVALGAIAAYLTLSIAWSAYPGASAIGVAVTLITGAVAVVITQVLSLGEVVRALSAAVRWILGLSLLFELAVATLVRQPLLPFWTSYEEPYPAAFTWSRNLLFEGGRIQGIVGNANLLAFVALLAVIVVSVQWRLRSTDPGHEASLPRVTAIGWVAIAVGVLALTRSSTVLVASLGVALALAVLLLARRLSGRARAALYGGAVAAAAGLTTAAIALRQPLLDLLGRSDDLTGRLDIWSAVIDLAQERPWFGWGWVSYWAPWVEPFDDLVVIRGVTYLQAHNAWLDVWLQLGILGLILMGVFVLTTTVRTIGWAVDAPRGDIADPAALRLAPALILAMLLVHSLAESRLLIEAGLLLLVWIAVASRRHELRWHRAGATA
ncbi:MAG: O-antigen ligase family protein [Microcella pacifica]|uniref:O-antigen ligase family protein n=1 Tax=Microcella pacifica TaxID=2591847 RepID=UPI0033155064